MSFKVNNKVVIIFAILLSFFIVGGGCYSLLRRNKVQEIEKEPEALKDIGLCCQQLDEHKQKVTNEKKINQENLEKNIKTLTDLGIWDWFKDDYEAYLDAVQSSQKAFGFQLDKLFEKVEKDKDLKSFHEELEKLSKKQKKDITEKADTLAKIAERMQEEVEKPMPFFATWTGVIVLTISCPLVVLVGFFCTYKYSQQKSNFNAYSFNYVFPLSLEFGAIFFNCLLLIPNCFKEMNKRHLSYAKVLALLLIPAITSVLNTLILSGCNIPIQESC